eukprot:m.151830 g.151830  ORF g.151830 m.151830 type:complete len:184 (-) comp30783_c1_seq2:164-715(-)
MSALKIVMIGPSKVGKSVLANFFCDPVSEPVRGAYRPTKGCRILEFTQSSGKKSIPIELWDVSGSKEYEDCWPGVIRQASGLILVFNPDVEDQEKELIAWYKAFTAFGIKPEDCLVFSNQSAHMRGNTREVHLPEELSHLRMITTNTQEGPDIIRDTFQDFVEVIDADARQAQNQAENNVLLK